MYQPNLCIQQPPLNIMDVPCHKMFGCFDVYDKDFLRQDESDGFWTKIDKIWIKAAALGEKRQN